MTLYECLQCKESYCREKANSTKDLLLKRFYFNAAIGFERKRRKLTLEQAGIIVG